MPSVSDKVMDKAIEVAIANNIPTSTPVIAKGRTDIKVVGDQSNFNYSISFEVITVK